MEAYIQMTMVVKLLSLKRSFNPNFTYEPLEDLVYKEKWKKNKPSLLNEAVNEIMNIKAEELVQFLVKQAIVSSNSIDDFNDLLGGKVNESN